MKKWTDEKMDDHRGRCLLGRHRSPRTYATLRATFRDQYAQARAGASWGLK